MQNCVTNNNIKYLCVFFIFLMIIHICTCIQNVDIKELVVYKLEFLPLYKFKKHSRAILYIFFFFPLVRNGMMYNKTVALKSNG